MCNYAVTLCRNAKQLKRFVRNNLVNLLNSWSIIVCSTSWSTSTWEATWSAWHTTWHTSSSAISTLVELHHDWVGNSLKLLLVLLVLLLGSLLRLIQPGDGLVDLSLELLLLRSIKLLVNLSIRERVAEGVCVRLKTVLGADTSSLSLILSLVLLGLGQHALDILLRETALVVGDGDLVGLSGSLLESRNVHDSVGIKIEGNLDLWDTTRRRWNTSELELAQKVVVLSSLTLAFKYLNEHTRLVVGKCRENFGLLGWDGGVSWDKLGHLSTGGLDTKGKWRNIEEENFVGALGGCITRENGSLDGSSVGDGLIRVDGLVGLLAVEVVGDQLLDTCGTSNQDNLVDLGLVNLSISEDTVDWSSGRTEEILAKLLESGTGDGGVEIDTLEQGVNLN